MKRYPAMRVVAPELARSAVDETVSVDDTVGDFGDPTVRFVSVVGTKGESVLIVRHESGATLVVNDLIANVQDSRGIMKLVLTLMGFAGSRPQVPRMFKKFTDWPMNCPTNNDRFSAAKGDVFDVAYGAVADRKVPGGRYGYTFARR